MAPGRSSGTAVAARGHTGLGDSQVANHMAAESGIAHRYHVRHWAAVFTGGFNLCSLYCIAGIGLSARANADLLEKAGKVFRAPAGPWIICMDGKTPRHSCRPQGG